MINFLSINRKRLNESKEDDFEWVDDVLKSEIRVKDNNIPLNTKVKVKINHSGDYPCPVDEDIKNDYYNGTVVHIGLKDEGFVVKLDESIGDDCGWICRVEVKHLGDERCWWVNPEYDEIYVDNQNLNESEEDELEWAQDLMNQNPIPKSIKLGDGKRFIIPSSKSYSKDWGKFRGWNYWKDVVRIDGAFGEHCYVINDRTWGEIYVPIIDFNPNEIKFDNLNESEDLEWAEDVVNSPIKGVFEGQYYRVNNDMSDEPFYYTIDIFVKEITRGPKNTQDIIYYDSLCNSEDADDMENDNKTDEVVTYNRAKELVETGYWIPITKEQSLFSKENINESEYLEWAEEVVNDEFFRWGDIKKHLDDGDIISVTGDMRDSEGELDLILDNEPFIVKRSGSRINLKWSNSIDERPKEWETPTELNKDWIPMLSGTAEWDDELIIKILKKEEHPF